MKLKHRRVSSSRTRTRSRKLNPESHNTDQYSSELRLSSLNAKDFVNIWTFGNSMQKVPV